MAAYVPLSLEPLLRKASELETVLRQCKGRLEDSGGGGGGGEGGEEKEKLEWADQELRLPQAPDPLIEEGDG